MGKSVVERPDYFFLDDSYIRILLEYGIIVFVVVMAILIIVSRRAAYAGRMTMVFAITTTNTIIPYSNSIRI